MFSLTQIWKITLNFLIDFFQIWLIKRQLLGQSSLFIWNALTWIPGKMCEGHHLQWVNPGYKAIIEIFKGQELSVSLSKNTNIHYKYFTLLQYCKLMPRVPLSLILMLSRHFLHSPNRDSSPCHVHSNISSVVEF